MAPARTMTGDTLVTENEKRELQSPASPTDTIYTSNTLSGDAIIEIASDDGGSTTRPSHDSNSSVPQDALPPRTSRLPPSTTLQPLAYLNVHRVRDGMI